MTLQQFKKWHRDTEVAIENTFVGEYSPRIGDFKQIGYWSHL